ncbi:MAG: cytochrome c [Gammaproteobacteria bacterium]|nr:cytochrome c [Gammaproteobacteria bacterium]
MRVEFPVYILICIFISACAESLPSQKVQAVKQAQRDSDVPVLVANVSLLADFDQLAYDNANYVEGARLYDLWWANPNGSLALALRPVETHPLWPGYNRRAQGSTTWRCKSCHGWDYRGVDGLYGDQDSRYFTKYPGLLGSTNYPLKTITPEEIYHFIANATDVNGITVGHDFKLIIADPNNPETVNANAIYDLTKFIVNIREQAVLAQSPTDIIDSTTRLTSGVEANGAVFFDGTIAAGNGSCAGCHGANGRAFALGPSYYISNYAQDNPWEVLHKIRFGQPGSGLFNADVTLNQFMQGLEDFNTDPLNPVYTIQDSANLLAFAQNGLTPSSAGFDWREYQIGSAGMGGGMGGVQSQRALTDFSRGGILWDTWWTGVNETLALMPPTDPDIVNTSHPLWPSTNSKSGDTTWRCKSCHGWDYRGKDGFYGTPGHAYETGIVGIVNVPFPADPSLSFPPKNTEPATIFDFLVSGSSITTGAAVPLHVLQNTAGVAALSRADAYALTRFVSEIQKQTFVALAPSDFIEDVASETSGYHQASGADASVGFRAYTGIEGNADCLVCHGANGQMIDFDGNGRFVSAIAKDNPWEVLHKIRFGQPGSDMLGLHDSATSLYRSTKMAADILRYTQAGLESNLARGGRLYDDLFLEKAMDGALLSAFNPLITDWAGIDVLAEGWTMADSYRCSQCHGFHYEGMPELYNDLLWLREIRQWTTDSVFKIFDGYVAYNAVSGQLQRVHDYNLHLNDQDRWDLAAFAMNGIIDTNAYIRVIDGAPVRDADLSKGQLIYHGGLDFNYKGIGFDCVSCHLNNGEGVIDGNGDPINIFWSAWESPWRVFHKIRFGAPGSIDASDFGMHGLVELETLLSDQGVSPQNAADVLHFTQQELLKTVPVTP